MNAPNVTDPTTAVDLSRGGDSTQITLLIPLVPEEFRPETLKPIAAAARAMVIVNDDVAEVAGMLHFDTAGDALLRVKDIRKRLGAWFKPLKQTIDRIKRSVLDDEQTGDAIARRYASVASYHSNTR